MNYAYLTVFEIVGTIAFAVSGSVVAIKREMDILGVIVLGLVTAVGGGVIRDVIIGKIPPGIFLNPTAALLSIAVSILVFVWMYEKSRLPESRRVASLTEYVLFFSDTVGLAAFTMLGIQASIPVAGKSAAGLLLFVGVITGVGGGILRDVLAGQVPYVLKKHVYATASLLGAVCCVLLLRIIRLENAMLAGAAVVIITRVLAAHFKWNLPHIPQQRAHLDSDCQETGRVQSDCQETGRVQSDCQETGRVQSDCQETGRVQSDCQKTDHLQPNCQDSNCKSSPDSTKNRS